MKGPQGFLWVTLVVIVALVSLHSAVTPDLSERNTEFFTEMVYSKANEAFSSSSHFPNGRTQQSLVDGVVVRGSIPFDYAAGTDEAVRAGLDLSNPYSMDDEPALLAGREFYGIYCGLCHDAQGNGHGTVVQHGMVPPPSLHGVRAKNMKDGEIFHILTRGQGNMASYASQMSPEERWKTILHVRKLQETN